MIRWLNIKDAMADFLVNFSACVAKTIQFGVGMQELIFTTRHIDFGKNLESFIDFSWNWSNAPNIESYVAQSGAV